MPNSVLFTCIGVITSSIAGGLWGLFYYLCIVNFVWWLTMIYAPVFFLALGATFVSYAMFRAAVFGEMYANPYE